MTQLKHQRRSNKHILSKLSSLEEQLQAQLGEDSAHLLLKPSEFLLQGYNASNVDEEVSEETESEKQQEVQRAVLSRASSVESSSEMSDMLRRFRALKNSEKEEEDSEMAEEEGEDDEKKERGTPTPSNAPPPPDLISENMPRLSTASEEDPETEERVVEDPIVLPDHLQSMVDEAMQQLLLEE